MKAVNKISQILAIVFSAAAVVLFFLPFADIQSILGNSYTFNGAQLAFGTKVDTFGQLAKSSQILFCFILSIISVLFAGLTFKFKKIKYWAPAVTLATAIYMLVITLSRPGMFVDARQIPFPSTTYTPFVLLITLALFAGAIFGACHLFVNDIIMVREGKAKKTILQRLIATLRDYKSELKKIVWPGVNDVVKNTLIVIIMCAIIGAFIWLVDLGLIELLQVFNKK